MPVHRCFGGQGQQECSTATVCSARVLLEEVGGRREWSVPADELPPFPFPSFPPSFQQQNLLLRLPDGAKEPRLVPLPPGTHSSRRRTTAGDGLGQCVHGYDGHGRDGGGQERGGGEDGQQGEGEWGWQEEQRQGGGEVGQEQAEGEED